MTNQTQDLYHLLHQLRKEEQDERYGYILTHKTPEGRDWWLEVIAGNAPPIPAESIEDLRKAGMMPEPEKVIQGFERVDTAPPFLCKIRHYGTPCAKQCAECDADAQAARKHNDALTNGTFVPPPFYCQNSESTAEPCAKQCNYCLFTKDLPPHGSMPVPSITLEDYARMEREEEAITSPAHYKVCEGLEVVDMLRAVLTPEQFKGYCLGNLIKYRMRAGKKTMSPMEDLGKAHVYETWLAEMEGGESSKFDKLYNYLAEEHNLLLVESEKQEILNLILNP